MDNHFMDKIKLINGNKFRFGCEILSFIPCFKFSLSYLYLWLCLVCKYIISVAVKHKIYIVWFHMHDLSFLIKTRLCNNPLILKMACSVDLNKDKTGPILHKCICLTLILPVWIMRQNLPDTSLKLNVSTGFNIS